MKERTQCLCHSVYGVCVVCSVAACGTLYYIVLQRRLTNGTVQILIHFVNVFCLCVLVRTIYKGALTKDAFIWYRALIEQTQWHRTVGKHFFFVTHFICFLGYYTNIIKVYLLFCINSILKLFYYGFYFANF